MRRLEVTTVNKKSSLKRSLSSLRFYLARDVLLPRTTTLLSTHRWTRVRWPRASLKRARIPNQPILLSPLLRTLKTLMLARAKESNSTSILLSGPYLKGVRDPGQEMRRSKMFKSKNQSLKDLLQEEAEIKLDEL